MVQITLTPDMFDDSGGEILYYAIIVGRDIHHNNRVESGTRKTVYDWPVVNNWAESSAYDFILAYQATPSYWDPFEGESELLFAICFSMTPSFLSRLPPVYLLIEYYLPGE